MPPPASVISDNVRDGVEDTELHGAVVRRLIKETLSALLTTVFVCSWATHFTCLGSGPQLVFRLEHL